MVVRKEGYARTGPVGGTAWATWNPEDPIFRKRDDQAASKALSGRKKKGTPGVA